MTTSRAICWSATAAWAAVCVFGPLARGLGAESVGTSPPPARASETVAHAAPIPPTAAVATGEYWLGLLCRAIDEPTRAQLGLAGKSALIVEQVVPDSPAERAGFQTGDLLLQLDGKPLKLPEDLPAAVQQSGGKKIELKLRRGEQEMTIAVAPEKRPELRAALPADLPEAERMRRLFEQLGADQAARARQAMRWHSLGPGLIVRVEPNPRAALPDDTTIAIQKSGRQPAEIVVTHGGQTYRVREDQIDRLPEAVRPHVEAMLGRAGAGSAAAQRFGPAGSAPLPLPTAAMPRIDLLPTAEPSMEMRIEELTRRVEALTRTVEQLQRQIGSGSAAPPRELPHAPVPAENEESQP